MSASKPPRLECPDSGDRPARSFARTVT